MASLAKTMALLSLFFFFPLAAAVTNLELLVNGVVEDTMIRGDDLDLSFVSDQDWVMVEIYFDLNENDVLDETDVILTQFSVVDNLLDEETPYDIDPAVGSYQLATVRAGLPLVKTVIEVSDGDGSQQVSFYSEEMILPGVTISGNIQYNSLPEADVFVDAEEMEIPMPAKKGARLNKHLVGGTVIFEIWGGLSDINGDYNIVLPPDYDQITNWYEIGIGDYSLISGTLLEPDFYSLQLTADVTALDFDFTDAPSVIHGTVTDENGAPLENLLVMAEDPEDTTGEIYGALTDALGIFEIGVVDGNYNVLIDPIVLENQFLEPDVQEISILSATIAVPFVLYSLDTLVTGQVMLEGIPLAGNYLIRAEDPELGSVEMLTADDGSFELWVNSAGDYEVCIIDSIPDNPDSGDPLPAGYVVDGAHEIEILELAIYCFDGVLPGETVDFNFILEPEGAIQGTVLLAEPLLDHEQIFIFAIPADSVSPDFVWAYYTLTNENGSFELDGIEDGNYYLMAGLDTNNQDPFDLEGLEFSEMGYYEGINLQPEIIAIFGDTAAGIDIDMEPVYVGIKKSPVLANFSTELESSPTPFHPLTNIRYALPKQQGKSAVDVTLGVYDLAGKEVKRLYTGRQSPGSYQFVWKGQNTNGESLASGTYLVKLQAESMVRSVKVILIK